MNEILFNSNSWVSSASFILGWRIWFWCFLAWVGFVDCASSNSFAFASGSRLETFSSCVFNFSVKECLHSVFWKIVFGANIWVWTIGYEVNMILNGYTIYSWGEIIIYFSFGTFGLFCEYFVEIMRSSWIDKDFVSLFCIGMVEEIVSFDHRFGFGNNVCAFLGFSIFLRSRKFLLGSLVFIHVIVLVLKLSVFPWSLFALVNFMIEILAKFNIPVFLFTLSYFSFPCFVFRSVCANVLFVCAM